MPLLRRNDANSRSNVMPVTGVPDHRAANNEKDATLTKQANDFRGRIFSHFREKIFSREDIFAGRYFRVNSIFAKISSRENISNSLFAKFSSRENKVLYSTYLWFTPHSDVSFKSTFYMVSRVYKRFLQCCPAGFQKRLHFYVLTPVQTRYSIWYRQL